LQGEGLAGILAFAAGFLLFTVGGALADGVEQFAFFFFEEFLAVGAAPFFAVGGGSCGRSAGWGSGTDVGELFDGPAVEGEGVEIVGAGEGDAAAVAGEAGIGFAIDGAGQAAGSAGGEVVDEDIAVADVDGLGSIDASPRRRREERDSASSSVRRRNPDPSRPTT
jgi:hypothetical protein